MNAVRPALAKSLFVGNIFGTTKKAVECRRNISVFYSFLRTPKSPGRLACAVECPFISERMSIAPRMQSSLAPEQSLQPAGQNPERELVDEDEQDTLYRMIELELRGHEDAVLDSYQYFLVKAASELEIPVSRVFTPLRNYERFSLLKSAFIYKKHMVQYEIRTYYRVIQLKHLTGSTADTYLEYVQRNLPEGVAMRVTKCAIEAFPEELHTPSEPLKSEQRNEGNITSKT